ncbi:MAG: NfeD family protein [Bacteroidetes bacterium]|jgi:membrane-bound ClpP family serine protease|nr:NfeD family protein [Bacteroidota bacterium]
MAVFLSILLLIIIGIVLLVLEILILPGLIAGIIGSIMVIAGVWYSFHVYGSEIGSYTALGTLLLTGITIYFSFRYNVWRKFSLEQKNDSKLTRVDEMDVQPGAIGTTISAVRPSGTAMFNHRKIEVQSMGELIETNTQVEVVEVLPNKLIVRKHATS